MTPPRAIRPRGSVETGLRTATVWRSIDQLVTAQGPQPLRIVDLGGGSGGLAVALAARGHQVLVIDPSPDALASAQRRAHELDHGGIPLTLTAVQGDADTLVTAVAAHQPWAQGVDLLCCHAALEVTDNPLQALQQIRQVLVPGTGRLSLVAAGRVGAVLSRALTGQLDDARAILTSATGSTGTSDTLRHRFTRQELLERVTAAGLTVHEVQGVHTLSELVPSRLVDSEASRAALLALEELACERDEVLAQLGAHHVIAGT